MSYTAISPTTLAVLPRIENLENKYEPSTRWALISANSGTTGSVTLPPQAVVLQDSFAASADALVCSITNGKPDFKPVWQSLSQLAILSFDSAGNYTLSASPTSDVAILYNIIQKAKYADLNSPDVIWSPGQPGPKGP